MRFLTYTTLALSALATVQVQVKAYPVSSFFPYGSAQGDWQPPRNDDDAWGWQLPTGITFPVYGHVENQISIGNNGIINFAAPINTYTPAAFPLNIGPAFTPFWADVDTRNTADLSSGDENQLSVGFYSTTTGGTNNVFKPIPTAISNKFRSITDQAFPSESSFTPNMVVVATWDRVGYYSYHNDKRNTFQAVMGTDGVRSFVCFEYARLEWTTGDASGGSNGFGGVSVNAGFNNGDAEGHYTSLTNNNVPPPLDPQTGLLANSNVGIPGLYCWSVAGSIVRPADADIRGDPQFVGFQGQSYQVHGADSTAFALISSPSATMNGDFVYLGTAASTCDYNETACWSHPGTYIGRLGFRVHVSESSESFISIASGSHAQGMVLEIDNVLIDSIHYRQRELSLGNSTIVRINRDGSINVRIIDLVEVHVMNSDYFLNMGVQLLRGDWLQRGQQHIKSKSAQQDQKIAEEYSEIVPLGGLIGQTWRKVTYSNNMPFRGDVMDYALEASIDASTPAIFDYHFAYNMYQPPVNAAPVQHHHNKRRHQ